MKGATAACSLKLQVKLLFVVAARRDTGQGAARRNAVVRARLLAGAVQPAQSQEPHGGRPAVPQSIPPAIESSSQPRHGSRADASTLPRARAPGTFFIH